MTIIALSRASDGYELEMPKVETYLSTYANMLQGLSDPAMGELAEDIFKAVTRFQNEIHNIMQEVNQYLDILASHSRR